MLSLRAGGVSRWQMPIAAQHSTAIVPCAAMRFPFGEHGKKTVLLRSVWTDSEIQKTARRWRRRRRRRFGFF